MLEWFDAHGNVKPGIHEWSLTQFAQCFVFDQQMSSTRQEIAQGFLRLFHEILDVTERVEVLVGGPFATQQINPTEISLVTIIPAQHLSGLTAPKRKRLAGKFNGKETAKAYGCNSLLLVSYDPADPAYQAYLNEQKLYYQLLMYDKKNRPQGIIKLTIDRAGLESAFATLYAGGITE
ncbi:DUF6932 family protein [Brevibacillus dissolubilis]|uniref:DUF6932 family protein n=1 Tax=Brevibacillus dissolubilis TaxID=1844116 RepID=UPI0011178612|nr:hypothetical protein [Brevibacillus dissolubilis]